MTRFAGALVLLFCCVPWALGGEARGWLPGPSAMNFGVVADGHLLSYQWEPAPHIRIHDDMSPSVSDYLSPAERYWTFSAAEGWRWEPKDIRWFRADLERGDVKPLKDARPDEGEALSQRGSFWIGVRPHNAPHRWRVGGGYLWGTGGGPSWLYNLFRTRFVIGKASPRAESSTAREAHHSAQLPGKEATQPSASTKDPAAWTPEVPFLGSYTDTGLASNLVFVNSAFRRGAREGRRDFDFIVASSNHIVLVALVNGRVTVGDYRLRLRRTSAQGTSWNGEWRLRVDFFDVPFSEPFHVATTDGAFFFVTDSGAVYMAEEIKGQWKTRAVWKDASRPIIAMLVEADQPGGFVFGKDFYFRLARDVKPKPCEDLTKGQPDLADPMRTVFQCGLLLYKNGELKKPN